jgi:hypothetical protein
LCGGEREYMRVGEGEGGSRIVRIDLRGCAHHLDHTPLSFMLTHYHSHDHTLSLVRETET